MSNTIGNINFKEAEFFYKNPHALVDYSQMQSFSLIKSSVEIFAYYGINDFSPSDIKEFFDCCLTPPGDHLSFDGSMYHIEKWNSDGYKYELLSARQRGIL